MGQLLQLPYQRGIQIRLPQTTSRYHGFVAGTPLPAWPSGAQPFAVGSLRFMQAT